MKSSDFKRIAKDSLRGNRFKAFIASIVAGFFGASTLNNTSVSFSFDFGTEPQPPVEDGDNITTAFNMVNESIQGDGEAFLMLLLIFLGFMASVAFIYSIVMLTVGSAVSVGYCQFNLDIIDGGDATIGTLFSRFSQMKTAIFTKMLSALYILVGLVFLIVPGIRNAYAYSMANFVMAENPDMTAREVLRESKRVMKGQKWKLFCLECSFILPIILCVFTLGIGFIWLIPHANATYAAFYRNAKDEAGYIA